MGPLLIPILAGAIDLIIGKLKANEPVDATEIIKAVAPAAAQAESIIKEDAKDVWVEELHNGGFMATNWRPLAALVSLAGLAWEGIALPVIGTFVTIPSPPEYISTAFLMTLLTLIGARGIEKIAIVRARK